MENNSVNTDNHDSFHKTIFNLVESHIFYKHLAELTPEAIVVHSEGTIVYANHAALKLVGAKKAEDFIGKPVMQFVHPDSIPLIKKRIDKMLKKKKIAPFIEEKFINLKGEILIAETKAVPFNFDGKEAILAILHDITANKILHDQLIKNELRYRTLIQQSADAIQLINKKGKIIYASDSIKQVTGFVPEEVVGHMQSFNMHMEDRPAFQNTLASLIRYPAEKLTVEYRLQHKNGSWVWIEATWANQLGNTCVNAIVGNFRNITQRKIVEERLRFLEQVSTLLGATIDYKFTLQTISKLLVPYFADYIRIVLVNESNQLDEVVAYHHDLKKIPLVKKLYSTYKGRKEYVHGADRVLEKMKPEIIEHVTLDMANSAGTNKKMENIISRLGLTSYMGVPLKLSDRTIGVITFSSSRKDRIYSKQDLHFAGEIATRIAYAVENARLYRNVELELYEKTRAQEQQARMSELLDQTFDAILLWELSGKILYWNKGAERLYGYTKEEAIGKTVHSLLKTVHPIAFPKIKEEILKKGYWEGELEHTNKKSRQIIVSCKKVLIVEKDGSMNILETNRDITDRVRFEKNLSFLSNASAVLASSLDYKTTLKNVVKLAIPEIADWCSVSIKNENNIDQLVVAHIDPKKVKWANELSKKNPPRLDDEAGVAKVIRTGKSEFYPNITREMILEAAATHEQRELIEKLSLSSVMMVPLKSSKETIGVITFIYAESGRHYTKSDLAFAEELAVRAGLAIENAKLYTDAQKAVVLRDEFISLASHELKTPLTSLKMYSQLLQKQFGIKIDSRLRYYLDKMNQQTEKLTTLINDLLNVSKIRHGKLEFNMEEVNINDLILETVEALQDITRKHKLIIEGNSPHTVYVDRYRIYQVLTNLLTNAIKYSPDADKIIIRIAPELNRVVVYIQDFGIGIDRDQQKKIFSQFYRVSNPEDKTFPGLGMGLYISHEIVERHGGSMSVVSARGKGAQFSFTLPYFSNVTYVSQPNIAVQQAVKI